MSSPRRPALGAPAALVAAVLLAGCTVQPLYSGSVSPAVDAGAAGRVTAVLGQVYVEPVSTRAAQEVRNELIFQLSGGRGNPVDAPYRMRLSASRFTERSTVVNTSDLEQSPTASILTFVGSYRVTEAATGRLVASGQRRATANYDVPNQPFAQQRAVRDAENRAARELAAFLSMAVAADLSTGRGVPVVSADPEPDAD